MILNFKIINLLYKKYIKNDNYNNKIKNKNLIQYYI